MSARTSVNVVYQKVVRLSLRSASNLSKRRIFELSSGIGELRQLLSCVVCCQLLVDPYGPKGRRCHHYVCRLCIRGRKRLMARCRQCEDCSDFKTYEENRLMAIQLLCYKTLCVRLLQSAMFAQLAGLFPDLSHVEQYPRIRLPAMTTQEFIREGTNYDDVRDSFLPQPDLPFLRTPLPPSLPAETPPTTAATTPELPYEQNLPDQLSITDIELEAAATAEHSHFSHPLPLMPTGSRMGLMAAQSAYILNEGSGSLSTEAAYTEHSWNEQVDLSDAVSMSSFPHNTAGYAMAYVMQPTGASTPFDAHPSQELQIGQVVHIEESTQPALLGIATAEVELLPSQKRKFAQLEMEQQEEESEPEAEPEPEPEQAVTTELVLEEIDSQEKEAHLENVSHKEEAHLENVSHEEEYLENVSHEEEYLENVSHEEEYLENVSQEETALEIASQEVIPEPVSQEEAYLETVGQEGSHEIDHPEESQETVSQDGCQESASRNTSRESVTEQIYKEIVSEELYQDSSSQEASQQESAAQEMHEEIARQEEASQEIACQQEATPEIVSKEEAPQENAIQEEAPQENVSREESHNDTISVSSETEQQSSSQENSSTSCSSNEETTIRSSLELEPAKPIEKKAVKAASPAPVAVPEPAPAPAPVPVPVPEPVPATAKATTKTSAKSSTQTKSQTATGSSRRTAGKTKEKPPKPICRCGTSGVSVNPKTTCRNTRCPCYKSGNTCTNCHCIGCHNPHKMDYLDSDDELDGLEPTLSNPQSEKEPAAPTATATRQVNAEKAATSAASDAGQGGISLVPLSNLQQSQHPLVLVQNENGEYQGFNIFQGNVPIDPATVGFLRVQLQNNDSNSTIPQYAYVMPPPPPVAAATTTPTPPPPTTAPAAARKPAPSTAAAPTELVEQQAAKKFKPATKRSARLRGYPPRNTIDELVSGGSSAIGSSAAGDRLSATDNAHSLFEEIMSGSDDL